MPRGDAQKRDKHVWRALSKRLWTIMKRTINKSMLVCKEDIKNNFNAKNIYFIPMAAVRCARMPSDFDMVSIKTWKNNGCFSHGPLQGVIPTSLIGWELASVKLYKTSWSSKFIPFSERSLSIFIWKGKGMRFNLKISLKERISKIAVNLIVCTKKCKISKTTTQSNYNVHNQHDSLKWKKWNN